MSSVVDSVDYEATRDIQERGGEATVEVLSLVHDMSDAQGEHVASPKPSSRWVLTAHFSLSVAERESHLSVCVQHLFILRHVVEQRKTRLAVKQVVRSNVDWLTEAIRRFSETYALGRDFATVTMSNVFRCEKVRGRLYFSPRSRLSFRCNVGPVEDHRNTLC
jgi:hypothetical protein